MTTTDIKIKYLFDRGHYPKMGYGYDYAEWIEDKLGGQDNQDVFFKDTSLHPYFINRRRMRVYASNYIKWLEEKYCKVMTFLEELE